MSITHPEMTRFSVPVGMETALVLFALANSQGGEIFIPKSPSYKITDVARAICPDCELKITGIRSGEKLKEDLIDLTDAGNTYDLGNYFMILPTGKGKSIYNTLQLNQVAENFHYSSDTNEAWLDIQAIQAQIADLMQETDIPEL